MAIQILRADPPVRSIYRHQTASVVDMAGTRAGTSERHGSAPAAPQRRASTAPRRDGAVPAATPGGAVTWNLVLGSDVTRLVEARRLVEEVAEVAGIHGSARYQLTLAVHEAVANAMEHGAAFAAPVRIRARLETRCVTFAIADPGAPFSLECPSQPHQGDRGRGLTLIRSCVDDLSVRRLSQGKEVRLVKRLDDGGASARR